MSFFGLFFFFGFFTYLVLGIYALRYNPRSPLRIGFLVLCILFAVLTLENQFYFLFRQSARLMVFHRVVVFGWSVFGAAMLHFFILLTRRSAVPRKWLVYPALYLPGILFGLRAVLVSDFLIREFRWVGPGWAPVYNVESPWFWAFQAYYVLYFAGSFLLALRWGRNVVAYSTDSIRFYNLVDTIPAAVFILRDNGIVFLNLALSRLTGFRREELFQKDFADLVRPDHAGVFLQKNIRQSAIGSLSASSRTTLPVIRKDGSERWLDLTTVEIIYEGHPAILGAAFDITVLKEAEKLLRISEERYRAIIEDQTELICRYLPDGTITFVNEAYCRYFGKKYDELVGRSFLPLIPEDDWPKITGRQSDNQAAGRVDEVEHRVYDARGHVRWQRWVNRAIPGSDGKTEEFQGVGRDITELRQAAEERDQLSRAVDQSSSAVIITDADGNLEYANRKFTDMTGFGREDMLGKNPFSLFPAADRSNEVRLVFEDLQAGRDCQGETLLRKKNGETYWLSYTLSPIRDSEGRLTHFVGVGDDVTQRKKFEEEMMKVNKLDSLVVLAGGLGHDLNNILTALTGNLSLARVIVRPDDKIAPYLAEAEKAAYRARDLSWQFLTFSKDRKADRKNADVGRLIRETAQFALRGSPVAFKIYVPDNLWPVELDEGQFCQVIDNMVINAVQAMPGGGMVQIKCENFIISSDKHYLPLAGGKYIRITIRDTGSGISPEHLDKIFDPYFTTKTIGHGLGLTICYSIIKKHDGHIEAESRPGAGTTFSIYLPVTDRSQDLPFEKTDRVALSEGLSK